MELVVKTRWKVLVLLVVIGFAFTALPGCNRDAGAVLQGTYVNHAAGELSIANDTLSVERLSGEHYAIHRKTGYREIGEDGKPGRLQLHAEEWKAVYNAETGVMTESKKGRVLTFEKGALTLERSVYRRFN